VRSWKHKYESEREEDKASERDPRGRGRGRRQGGQLCPRHPTRRSRTTGQILTWRCRHRPQRRLNVCGLRPMASNGTSRPVKPTRAESLDDSPSMNIVIAWPTNHPRIHARVQEASNCNNNHTPATTRVLPRRMGKRRNISTPMTSSRKGRRRVAQGGNPLDGRQSDDSDDEVEIIVDAQRSAPRH
jgi:hypothetical protein